MIDRAATYFIGHTTDQNDRYKASSGGIGTAITRYLLSEKKYGTSITFVFNQSKCCYEPKLIFSTEDINVCGSIYHDINIFHFVKENIENIRGGIVLTCPPCFVKGIKQLLTRNNIDHFIISYCCSGQTSIEGTWKYYELLGINKEEVANMQYRGNGWPSGIQIWLKNGTLIQKDNYTEPWVTIHRSRLYQPSRCYFCKLDTSRTADISIADPWLPEYKNNDKIGSTLFLVNTALGEWCINQLKQNNKIEITPSCYNDYAVAQKPNVQKELRVLNQQVYLKRLLRLRENNHYFLWATRSQRNMRFHISLAEKYRHFATPKNFTHMIKRFFEKISNKIRFNSYKNKLGSFVNRFYISGGAIVNNPKCLHLGEGVGIGAGSFIGPVVEYLGIPYNPKIIIGKGTWVGKNCSIAAIDRVEIGEHVLFAGHVHITDHSHGYEDINLPMAKQPLISKGPVVIEDDCWLGFSCEILSGVHIGKHSVVAARAVVTKDVPSYSIVAGNPARIVKQYNPVTKQWEKYQKT